MPKPNKENIITEILTELAGGTIYTDCLANVGGKWRIPSRTFDRYWKDANSRYAITAAQAQEAISKGNIAETVKAAANGLKSKIERMMEIQKKIDDGVHEETAFNFTAGKAMKYMRKLTPYEFNLLNAELSKMAGEYAPAKVAQTDPEGNAVTDPLSELIKRGGKITISGK